MTRIGTLGTISLAALLQRIEMHHKTGCVLIEHDDTQDEIYVYQGQVTAVLSTQTRRPLLRRLLEAGEISVRQLRTLPAETGRVLSQVEKENLYSDKQVASELLQRGLIEREALISWQQRETEQELQKLMGYTEGHVSFEERSNVPDMLLDRSTDSITLAQPIDQETTSKSLSIRNKTRTTAETGQKSAAATGTKTPATALTALQTIPVIIQHTFPHRSVSSAHDMHTARVAVPPKPNPLFRWETLLMLVILLIAGLAHGINMFHFPYYYDDEGTYMAQAWAIIHEGRLAPYTYTYDHAPLGWIQIALWTIISGGSRTFGLILNSGRVFMLLIQICSTFLLYQIARRISGNILISTLVALLFALSPYGIFYHRRVLLDNICTLWMLVSIFLLASKRPSLKKVWLSAIALAISVLSKETTAFVVPALAYFVYHQVDASHRRFAIVSWFALFFVLISFYPLMAILKNEFFPSGTLLGGNAPHVSLIGTILYQASRGKDGGIFDLHSAFWQMYANWAQDDPTLVIGGSISAISSVLVIRWHRTTGIMGLMTLSLWLFLCRGGEVIGFYLVPLLPLLALNIGLIIWLISKSFAHSIGRTSIYGGKLYFRSVQIGLIALCLGGLLIGYSSPNPGLQKDHLALWNSSPTTGEQQAIAWIKEHVSTKSSILIDDFMWTDLHDTGQASKNYNFAYYYWKVEEDPAIQQGVFHNNWHRVDYVVTTIDMFTDAKVNNMTLVENALNHSTIIAKFDTGWPIEILKVNP